MISILKRTLRYISDMILSASSSRLLVQKLKQAFAIKDMGPLRFFLGIDVKRDTAASFFLRKSMSRRYLSELG
jgi:hypothetical protein